MRYHPVIFAILALVGSVNAFAQNADLTKAVRGLLESELREQVGIGFREFSCDAAPPLSPGDRFLCSAIDEEGDGLRYTLEIDAEGTAKVVLASQVAASLEPKVLGALSSPCLDFLQAFAAGEWDRLVQGLSPSLRSELEADDVVLQLEVVRSVLGEMSEPIATWYSFTDAGTHRLEFRLPGAVDGVVARFRLASDENGAWTLHAFLVHAEPGSPAGNTLIDGLGRSVLSEALGTKVVQIVAPFRELVSKGDLVEGSIGLDDGRQFPIVVQQTSDLRDFDARKYFFSVLDSELVVAKGVENRLEGVTGVECDAPQVPDGGEIRCVVKRRAAPPMNLLLSRQGAEHRLRSAPANGG